MIIVVLIFLLGISYKNRNIGRGFKYKYSPTNCTIDLYKFALLRESDKFMIHGLWPENCLECTTCSYPTFCKKIQFNLTEIKPLWQNISSTWYPGVDIQDNTLISHEWIKHGSCTNFTEFEFFNVTLNIYYELVNQGLIEKNCTQTSSQCFFFLDIDLHVKI